MKNVEVTAGFSRKEVYAPLSKSEANRLLILLSQTGGEILELPTSTDVTNLLNCLEQIGVHWEKDGSWKCETTFPACEDLSTPGAWIRPGDGGTTTRFLLFLLALGKKRYFVELHPSFAPGKQSRPMDEQWRLLRSLGVHLEVRHDKEKVWVEIQGPFRFPEGAIVVNAQESSQFLSGLGMILGKRISQLEVQGLKGSKDYWYMTQSLVRRVLKGERSFRVNPDWSSIPYPLALSLFFEGVDFPGVYDLDPLQADSRIMAWLEEQQVPFEFTDHGLSVKPKKELKGFFLGHLGLS